MKFRRIDDLPPYVFATVDALKRGGVAIEIGALTEPLPVAPMEFMTSRRQFRGSNWFTTGEGQLLAEMVATGVLDHTVGEATGAVAEHQLLAGADPSDRGGVKSFVAAHNGQLTGIGQCVDVEQRRHHVRGS